MKHLTSACTNHCNHERCVGLCWNNQVELYYTHLCKDAMLETHMHTLLSGERLALTFNLYRCSSFNFSWRPRLSCVLQNLKKTMTNKAYYNYLSVAICIQILMI